MRKIKEVLRLRFELGLGQRQIARSCAIGQGTVHEYLKRAQATGVGWPLPEGWDENKLEEALFGPSPHRVYQSPKPAPDFERIHEELHRHAHLTLQLVWEEYRQTHPDGYGYSYQVRSTILTSQVPVARWHEQIGDPTLADSILDRLVHNAHRLEMQGESLRRTRGGQAQNAKPVE